MRIEVDVKKRYFFGFLAVLLIVVGIVEVFGFTKSLGGVPNPGHALNTTQGYFSGDVNLEGSLGKFCQSDGTNCVSGDSQTGSVSGLYDYSQCVTKSFSFSTSGVVCDADSVVIGDNTERVSIAGSGGKMLCCKLNEPSKIDFSDKVTKNGDCGVDRVIVGINSITSSKIDYSCAKIKSSALLTNPICRTKDKNAGVSPYVADSSRDNELFNGVGYCVVS